MPVFLINIVSMKKIISIIVLAILVIGVLAPGISLAQKEKPRECCTLKQRIDLGEDGICGTKTIAAPDYDAARACKRTGTIDLCGTESWGMFCLFNTIYNVTNWLFYFLVVIAVLFVIIGGAIYMLSAGSTEKAERGKAVIIYAIVGLVLALIAKLIPSIVRLIIGMT